MLTLVGPLSSLSLMLRNAKKRIGALVVQSAQLWRYEFEDPTLSLSSD